jgi:hypothetical protein
VSALAAGCIVPTTLGPPRALPAGKVETIFAVVPAVSSAALHRYERPLPDEPEPGQPVSDQPDLVDHPPRASGTLVAAGRLGLGAGVDGELLYVGPLGIGAGTRVQLAGRDGRPFSAGLGARATVVGLGAGSTGDTGSLVGGDLQLYGTVAISSGDRAVYAGPRFHLAWLRASRERDGESDSVASSSPGAGATVGVLLDKILVEVTGLRMSRDRDDRATYHLTATFGLVLRL